MLGGTWRLVESNIETQEALQASSLGGFFIGTDTGKKNS
jgi:hypothetical protein